MLFLEVYKKYSSSGKIVGCGASCLLKWVQGGALCGQRMVQNDTQGCAGGCSICCASYTSSLCNVGFKGYGSGGAKMGQRVVYSIAQCRKCSRCVKKVVPGGAWYCSSGCRGRFRRDGANNGSRDGCKVVQAAWLCMICFQGCMVLFNVFSTCFRMWFKEERNMDEEFAKGCRKWSMVLCMHDVIQGGPVCGARYTVV